MSSEAELRREIEALQQRQAELEARLAQVEAHQGPVGRGRGRSVTRFLGLSAAQEPELLAQELTEELLEPEGDLVPKTVAIGKVEHLLGLQGFSWLGILALMTGLGLFIRYAYLEGWLGPLATLLAGTLLAVGMLSFGEWLSHNQRYRTWAHALMGGGVALLYFLVYAAYHFSYFRKVTHLSPLSDTLLLMAVVGLAIGLALRRRSQSLASRAFVLGFVTSLFSHDFVLLTLVYNLLLSLGLITVSARAGWSALALMGVVGSWLLHGIWLGDNSAQVLLGQALTLGYVGLYAALDEWLAAAALREQTSSQAQTLLRQSLGLVNLLGYAWLTMMAWKQLSHQALLWYLLAYLALMLILVLVAHRHERLRPLQQGFQVSLGVLALYWILAKNFAVWEPWVLLGIGSVLLGLARYWGQTTAEQREALRLSKIYDSLAVLTLVRLAFVALADPWLGLVLMLGVVALLAGQKRFPHWGRLALGVEIPLVLNAILEDFDRSYDLTGHTGFTAAVPIHALTLLGLLVGPLIFRKGLKQGFDQFLLWPVTAVLLIWFQAWLPSGWVSVAWAMTGTVLVAMGFGLRHTVLRYQGMAMLLVCGVKVYFWDLAGLSLGYRIVSLIVLGVLLLIVALLYTRFQAFQSTLPEQEHKQS